MSYRLCLPPRIYDFHFFSVQTVFRESLILFEGQFTRFQIIIAGKQVSLSQKWSKKLFFLWKHVYCQVKIATEHILGGVCVDNFDSHSIGKYQIFYINCDSLILIEGKRRFYVFLEFPG